MSNKLTVVLNGQAVIEYDRNIRLPGHQREFLDKMDMDMDKGIEMNGQSAAKPDLGVRAQYIAMHLIQAIQNDNESMISAMCAYLANRLPDLKKVIADEQGEKFTVDLVFTEEDNNKVAVQFDPNLMSKH
jgi:hypothetical protein